MQAAAVKRAQVGSAARTPQRYAFTSRRHVAVHATPGNGPSGINVQGARPTSPKGWQLMIQTLKSANVKLIAPQELVFAQEKGPVIIVDVRPESDYNEGHIPTASNVPFYQPIAGWSPWQVARRVGYAFFGVLNGTEVNPNFLKDVEACAPAKDALLILYCSQGGQLDPDEANVRGKQTRSLIAAYELVTTGGYTNVQVLKGGYTGWIGGGREVEVFEEAST